MVLKKSASSLAVERLSHVELYVCGRQNHTVRGKPAYRMLIWTSMLRPEKIRSTDNAAVAAATNAPA